MLFKTQYTFFYKEQRIGYILSGVQDKHLSW